MMSSRNDRGVSRDNGDNKISYLRMLVKLITINQWRAISRAIERLSTHSALFFHRSSYLRTHMHTRNRPRDQTMGPRGPDPLYESLVVASVRARVRSDAPL